MKTKYIWWMTDETLVGSLRTAPYIAGGLPTYMVSLMFAIYEKRIKASGSVFKFHGGVSNETIVVDTKGTRFAEMIGLAFEECDLPIVLSFMWANPRPDNITDYSLKPLPQLQL